MQYIIMCGGNYKHLLLPKALFKVNGETLISRTIRLLRENGIDDIAISTNSRDFNDLGVTILRHRNRYWTDKQENNYGYWVDAFYPAEYPVCYLFGDVYYSPEAIKTIIETETDDIEFFASAPPFAENYPKEWAEPFALKVINNKHLSDAVAETKQLQDDGLFVRRPIMWELWQVIKKTRINVIDYTNYTVINDYTCDIDYDRDLKFYEHSGGQNVL